MENKMAFWESTWKALNTLESMTGSYHSWVLAEDLQHCDICTSVFSVAQFTLVTMETTQVFIHRGEDGENVAHIQTHTQSNGFNHKLSYLQQNGFKWELLH